MDRIATCDALPKASRDAMQARVRPKRRRCWTNLSADDAKTDRADLQDPASTAMLNAFPQMWRLVIGLRIMRAIVKICGDLGSSRLVQATPAGCRDHVRRIWRRCCDTPRHADCYGNSSSHPDACCWVHAAVTSTSSHSSTTRTAASSSRRIRISAASRSTRCASRQVRHDRLRRAEVDGARRSPAARARSTARSSTPR